LVTVDHIKFRFYYCNTTWKSANPAAAGDAVDVGLVLLLLRRGEGFGGGDGRGALLARSVERL
jgi:hypothetical protein